MPYRWVCDDYCALDGDEVLRRYLSLQEELQNLELDGECHDNIQFSRVWQKDIVKYLFNYCQL